ncbi:MAG TPA: hypothetical protein VKI62_03150 [Bacteroidota bacterium]|nr:hypothetical protein [Bacteroidota bacterium]
MNSDIQQILALVIVGISAIWLVRSRILARRRAKLRPCGHDCHCSSGDSVKENFQKIHIP